MRCEAYVAFVSGLHWSFRPFQVTLYLFVLLFADLAARVAALEDVPRRLAARAGRAPAATTAGRRLWVASRSRVGHFAPLEGKSSASAPLDEGAQEKDTGATHRDDAAGAALRSQAISLRSPR